MTTRSRSTSTPIARGAARQTADVSTPVGLALAIGRDRDPTDP
jgi:hypothetical protein